jgi:hypothetical protein
MELSSHVRKHNVTLFERTGENPAQAWGVQSDYPGTSDAI